LKYEQYFIKSNKNALMSRLSATRPVHQTLVIENYETFVRFPMQSTSLCP